MSGWKNWEDLGPRENWPAGTRARQFIAADLIGASILCPHCKLMLEVKQAKGPYVGYNPDLGVDRFWVLTLADGETARFWEDRKGVLESDTTTTEHREP